MTHVKLIGELGEKFGEEWTSVDSSMRDVLKLIDCQVEGFKEYLAECHNKNVQFSIQNGDELFEDEEDLWLPNLKDTVIITPVPAGSGKGLGKLITGLLLLAAMFFIPGLGPMLTTGGAAGGATATAAGAFGTTMTATMGSAATVIGGGTSVAASVAAGASLNLAGMLVASLGVNLALMGLMEMSAPEADDMTSDPSFLFNGAGKNIEQGQPVPVLYGQMKIGGTPINEGFAPGTLNSHASSNFLTTGTSTNYKSDGTSSYTVQTAPHTGTKSSSDYVQQQ